MEEAIVMNNEDYQRYHLCQLSGMPLLSIGPAQFLHLPALQLIPTHLVLHPLLLLLPPMMPLASADHARPSYVNMKDANANAKDNGFHFTLGGRILPIRMWTWLIEHVGSMIMLAAFQSYIEYRIGSWKIGLIISSRHNYVTPSL